MCDEIGFVRWQNSSQEPQILELTELGIRCVDSLAYRNSKRGLVAEQAEEALLTEIRDLLAKN